jgi:hypothetical protein
MRGAARRDAAEDAGAVADASRVTGDPSPFVQDVGAPLLPPVAAAEAARATSRCR